ncbi:MAG: proton-conducting transporter membrane subunit [Candidatus Methanomethylophilaceae archaeon]|jgi:hydrogenase-4 component F
MTPLAMVLMPLIFGVMLLFIRNMKFLPYVSLTGAVAFLAVTVACCLPHLRGEAYNDSIWYIDSLSAFFLTVTAVISFAAVLYSKSYMEIEHENEVFSTKEVSHYYFIVFAFIAIILFTFSVRSAALTWIGIGMTTLVSAFLVGLRKDAAATEAAWKYIMLCSVGIMLALFGIALLFAASTDVIPDSDSLDWPALVLNALDLNPVLMKFAAAFFIIGLGTKAGLAPLHNWLPDAHSQAPGPVSGMMSGILLNCAMYGIMRFYTVSELVNPGFAKNILLLFGVLSLVIASSFILISKDFKRMLAYSSVENMGLIAIALGIGTPLALFGAVFQIMAHSVCKPLIFFCSGNVAQAYGTGNMSEIRNVSKKMKFTGFATAAGGLAVAGAPPFPLFIGELLIIFGAISAGMYWLAGFLGIILVFVFAALIKNIFPMLSGSTDKEVSEGKSPFGSFAIVLLIGIALFIGLFMPESMRDVFESMVLILSGGGA